MNFFERWGEFRCENEFVALDITSISTYSELINDAEWGYNRDKEKLPQVNVCMLMGEKSKLPILQVVYSGSLNDVSTLKTTLQTASGLELDGLSLVMDKGFAKIDNINAMLSKTSGDRFVIALPFRMGFAKDQVKREADGIDCAENTVLIGNDILRGATSNQAWNGDYDVFVHACFSPETFVYAKNNLYAKVKELIAQVLTKELLTTGWVIIISNYIDNAQEALQIYRGKDVVEKGFLRMKSCLDLARLRVHSDEVMQNKIFIGFIALIITAHIHKVMAENQLYKLWTMKKMLKILERLKIHHIKGDRILSPLTKDQKRIFSAFDLKSVL
jgi:transposase